MYIHFNCTSAITSLNQTVSPHKNLSIQKNVLSRANTGTLSPPHLTTFNSCGWLYLWYFLIVTREMMLFGRPSGYLCLPAVSHLCLPVASSRLSPGPTAHSLLRCTLPLRSLQWILSPTLTFPLPLWIPLSATSLTLCSFFGAVFLVQAVSIKALMASMSWFFGSLLTTSVSHSLYLFSCTHL